jgi:hypothetical protein
MIAKQVTDGRAEPSKPLDDAGEHRTGAWISLADRHCSRSAMLIAFAMCVSLVLAGVSLPACASPAPAGQAGHVASASQGQPATRARSGQPSAAASSPVAIGSRDAGDGNTGSEPRWPPRLRHRILRWKTGPGGVALAAVEKQMGTAMQAAGVRLYPAMRLACVSLASDVRTAQAGPPIPDNALQRLYAAALAGLSSAATDCQTAITTVHTAGDESTGTQVNEGLLTRSRAELAAMSRKLYRATSTIWSVHR